MTVWRKGILAGYAATIGVVFCLFALENWGHLFDEPTKYQELGLVTVDQLRDRPLTYIGKRIVVRGVVGRSPKENGYRPALFNDKTAAKGGEFGTYILLYYPPDALENCMGETIEVNGSFATVWPDQLYQIPLGDLGLDQIKYVGKVNDVASDLGLGAGLQRVSCQTDYFEAEFGVAAPYRDTSPPRSIINSNNVPFPDERYRLKP